jgi:hypothetical protein
MNLTSKALSSSQRGARQVTLDYFVTIVGERLAGDAQRHREERTTLEGMIQSRNELILEMAKEYGLNYMGENDDDEGNTITPPASVPVAMLEEIV